MSNNVSKFMLDTPEQAFARADAEQLAAKYDNDPDQLHYEYARRCGGSFATTVAGSPSERDRYLAAWVLSVQMRKVQEAQAAKEAAE